jgi:hypothetical protein
MPRTRTPLLDYKAVQALGEALSAGCSTRRVFLPSAAPVRLPWMR